MTRLLIDCDGLILSWNFSNAAVEEVLHVRRATGQVHLVRAGREVRAANWGDCKPDATVEVGSDHSSIRRNNENDHRS